MAPCVVVTVFTSIFCPFPGFVGVITNELNIMENDGHTNNYVVDTMVCSLHRGKEHVKDVVLVH